MADKPVTAGVGSAQQGQGLVKRFFELLMMLVSMVLVIFAWGEVSIVSKLFSIWNAHSAERRMRGDVKRERRKIYGRKERREKKRRDKREVQAEREDMRKGKQGEGWGRQLKRRVEAGSFRTSRQARYPMQRVSRQSPGNSSSAVRTRLHVSPVCHQGSTRREAMPSLSSKNRKGQPGLHILMIHSAFVRKYIRNTQNLVITNLWSLL